MRGGPVAPPELKWFPLDRGFIEWSSGSQPAPPPIKTVPAALVELAGARRGQGPLYQAPRADEGAVLAAHMDFCTSEAPGS